MSASMKLKERQFYLPMQYSNSSELEKSRNGNVYFAVESTGTFLEVGLQC